MAKSCLHIQPATFKDRIKLQAITQTTDGQGGYTDAWTDVATVWASIEQKSQQEAYYAMQMESPATHRFTMRFLIGITTKHRVAFGTRTFNITRVNNVQEANAFLEIDAVEGVAT